MKNDSHKFFSVIFIVLASGFLCALSLSFAIGVYDWNIFFGYFRHPLIFLLNWIPVVLLFGFFYVLTNRQFAAFLLTAVIIVPSSIGNYFKLKFRDEPFVFQDLGSIRAGLSVAGNYGVAVSKRIVLALLVVIIIAFLLYRFSKEKMTAVSRICLSVILMISLFPLWRFIYSDDQLYRTLADRNLILETWDSNQYFVANGFPYPFLHSITASRDIPPADYTPENAKKILSGFHGENIPEAEKVNLLVIQLESFADLEAMGVDGISSDTYERFRSIQDESVCGTMVANVIGGGTVDTERCFLSGSYGLQSYRRDSSSYVRYLNSQGYHTSFGHPNRAFFYNRQNIASYLGFEESFFNDNRYAALTGGQWRCDSAFLPDVFHQFSDDIQTGSPVFSFRVTIQGRAPYHNESFDDDGHFWVKDSASDASRYEVNNYLSSINETQKYLSEGLDLLRDISDPCVVMLYGDHKPFFDSPEAYQDLGIDFDMSTWKGVLDYYGTPWMIWANASAKEVFSSDFRGTGPTVSPGYLMNVLFQELGWGGNAFMQFTSSILSRLPVITSNQYYVEDGQFTSYLSEEGKSLLHDYECVQFYYRANPEESAA